MWHGVKDRKRTLSHGLQKRLHKTVVDEHTLLLHLKIQSNSHIQKCRRLLWVWARLRWTDAKWTSLHFRILEIMDLPQCSHYKDQNPASVMVWGCGIAHGMYQCPINADRYIQTLEQHVLPSWKRLFQEGPWLFQQDDVSNSTVKEYGYETGLPAVQTSVWRIMKLKTEQLKSNVQK